MVAKREGVLCTCERRGTRADIEEEDDDDEGGRGDRAFHLSLSHLQNQPPRINNKNLEVIIERHLSVRG